MICARCQGLMVCDMFLDLAETKGMWMHGLRCMNCGYVVDPVMEQNRRQQQTVASIDVTSVGERAA